MKYYVVADVHGFYSILKTTLCNVGYFCDKKPHKLIICGDIFDRGTETLEMQSFISDLIDKDEVILIKGNHEDLLINLVKELDRGESAALYGHNLSNGTTMSLLELTNNNLLDARYMTKKIAKQFYNTIFYKKIFPKMLNYYETNNYIFVHGWIPCYALCESMGNEQYIYQEDWREASEERWNHARWINGMLAASQGVIDSNKTIVCGHWHSSYGHFKLEGKCSEFDEDADFSPYYAKGIIAIDACTAHTGEINCVIIEDDDSLEFVARKILKEHKRVFEELAK